MSASSLVRLGRGDNERIVVCIPPAGGGASVFASWASGFTGVAALWAARLPGRECRTSEQPLQTVEEMALALVDPVVDLGAEEIVVFGHSSGSFVAYELSHLLTAAGEAAGVTLVVSSEISPRRRREPTRWSAGGMSVDEMIEELRKIGATPEEALADREFMTLLAPVIIADMRAAATYWDNGSRGPLSIPMIALGGTDDVTVPAAALAEWEMCTTGPFVRSFFEGRHSYISEHRDSIIRILASTFRGSRTGGKQWAPILASISPEES